jgi:hypothetical protein
MVAQKGILGIKGCTGLFVSVCYKKKWRDGKKKMTMPTIFFNRQKPAPDTSNWWRRRIS